MVGKASTTNSQTFNGTTIGVGANKIGVTTGAGGTTNLTLGAITRNTGGAVQFTLPTTGSISASGSLTNGILGGWATVGPAAGPTDLATISGGNVVAYSAYTN